MKATLLACVLLVITAIPVFADPIGFTTVALQDQGFKKVLLGNGLDPLLLTDLATQVLSFETSYHFVGIVVSTYTINVPLLHSTEGPFTDNCQGDCADIYGWMLPLSLHQITPGTLTATLNGVTVVYNFRYESVSPEPTSLLLLGTGLVAGFWRKHVTNTLVRRGTTGLS